MRLFERNVGGIFLYSSNSSNKNLIQSFASTHPRCSLQMKFLPLHGEPHIPSHDLVYDSSAIRAWTITLIVTRYNLCCTALLISRSCSLILPSKTYNSYPAIRDNMPYICRSNMIRDLGADRRITEAYTFSKRGDGGVRSKRLSSFLQSHVYTPDTSPSCFISQQSSPQPWTKL